MNDEQLARLRELETNFAAAVERAKLTALYNLAYGLSHEINNPLANISSRAQTLLIDEQDAERRKRLTTINAQAFRAHEMIADLMLFAKPPRLERRAFDLPALLATCVKEMRSAAAEQQTEISLSANVPILVVLADPLQIAEAVKAVVKNALEALGEHGSITLAIEAPHPNDDNAVAIVIRDSGPGIPPEVRPHIFDPYYCGREAGRGLGLGLAKCWRILDEHGGRVEVASEEGAGAEFRLIFPAGNPA